MLADEDRLEVRRQTNEQDKHLDVISDALSDLQRIGEVGVQTHPAFAALTQTCHQYYHAVCNTISTVCNMVSAHG